MKKKFPSSRQNLRIVKASLLVLTLLVLCLAVGCVYPRTTDEIRAESFTPYANAKIRQTALSKHILLRSGFLAVADEVTLSSDDRLKIKSKTAPSFGTAVAIDRRGYFLTAAHTLNNSPPLLVMGTDDGALHGFHARVVWRGDTNGKKPDLAILQIPKRLNNVFEWAPKYKIGDPVLASGLNHDLKKIDDLQFSLACFAGEISTMHTQPKSSPHWSYISHSGPGQEGDSGGPLVSTDGRLIGINIQVDFQFFIRWLSPKADTYAVRPDLNWLQQIIEEDQRAIRVSREGRS